MIKFVYCFNLSAVFKKYILICENIYFLMQIDYGGIINNCTFSVAASIINDNSKNVLFLLLVFTNFRRFQAWDPYYKTFWHNLCQNSSKLSTLSNTMGFTTLMA